MKRAGKCVGKRKYPYKDTAIEMAHWKYINQGVILGVYECPTCLDFHLTSKYCNLRHLHITWEQTRPTWTGTHEDIKKTRKKQRKQLKKKVSIAKLQPNPESKNSKKRASRKAILPLVEQRRILAELDTSRNPQPRSFWSWIKGIIKGSSY